MPLAPGSVVHADPVASPLNWDQNASEAETEAARYATQAAKLHHAGYSTDESTKKWDPIAGVVNHSNQFNAWKALIFSTWHVRRLDKRP